jgi:predicted nucleotidyltransferase
MRRNGVLKADAGCANMPDMDRQYVIAKLREHEPELRAAGVVHLSVFGSVARGEASMQSDVDLMAEFDDRREYSLLDRVRLENRLAEILGVSVDLAPLRTLKDEVRERATHEAVLALGTLIAPFATFSMRLV